MKMVFKGEGNTGLEHHKSDLIVNIKVAKDPVFTWSKDSTLVMTYTTTLVSALKSDPLRFKIFSLNGDLETITYPVD